MTKPESHGGAEAALDDFIRHLRGIAVQALARMYDRNRKRFVFRLRRCAESVSAEGLSHRYTAIALIGLAGEDEEAIKEVTGHRDCESVCRGLIDDAGDATNLGDVAVTLWAATVIGLPAESLTQKLKAMQPDVNPFPTVELSWTLQALCLSGENQDGLLQPLARRLLSAFNADAGMFPHLIGEKSPGPRSHVSCFADTVYPIQALASYHERTGDPAALKAATRCAEQICRIQGPHGQWWWHYDNRTGDVIEPYPVYAVHQDAMAPMALLALKQSGGPDFDHAIRRGVEWLNHSPEIDASLVDEGQNLIWRKVARKEPSKLSRYAQAAAARVHPSARVPGLDILFPPVAVDFETRPYHMGWILWAWPGSVWR